MDLIIFSFSLLQVLKHRDFIFWLSMWFPTILREVYHTKRMQHVICVRWSADNKYVLSASDEMNIRLWKANASEKLGLVSTWSHFMSKSTRKSLNSESPGFIPDFRDFWRVFTCCRCTQVVNKGRIWPSVHPTKHFQWIMLTNHFH